MILRVEPIKNHDEIQIIVGSENPILLSSIVMNRVIATMLYYKLQSILGIKSKKETQ